MIDNSQPPKISFCITCKNRLYQIKKTLPQNLEDNRRLQEIVEFVLVDFGSTDGLRKWISDNFKHEIRSGYLKYFYTEEMVYWHASIAKNTAHMLAQNDILVNLDCDNYTGSNGGWFVILQFIKNDGPMFLHQCSDDGFDGSFGRISIKRNDFLSIGGYNESLAPAGYQDLDLINRLMAKGYRRIEVKDSKYNRAIRNTKEEGIAFTHSSFKTWHEMDEYNAKISQSNILAGKLIANGGSFGIRKNIFDIEGNVPKEVDSLKYAHKISFNITCMNRLHHIKQTLQQNIHDNFLSEQVEFNLLDYNSTDGLERWVKQQGELFDTGIFNYYKTITPTYYHRTHSRNMAFRLSTGDIVCNLDADNYLGEGFAAYILNLFCMSDEKVFYTPRYSERDVIGRLCLWRKHFLSVNGYNEALPGYGLEDIELYYRLWNSGIEQEFISENRFCKAIHHSHEERVSQEYMGRHIIEMYLFYINPYQTQVLLRYQDGSYSKTILKDNIYCNYNRSSHYENINQYFLDEKNRIIGGKNPEGGQWEDIEGCLSSFYRVVNVDLQSEILVYLSETQNFWEIERYECGGLSVNPNGFGQGIAYKNFDYDNPIFLK